MAQVIIENSGESENTVEVQIVIRSAYVRDKCRVKLNPFCFCETEGKLDKIKRRSKIKNITVKYLFS